MNRLFLSTAGICAAGATLVSLHAQPLSQDKSMSDQAPRQQQEQQDWQSKHLSATGRMATRPLRASKVIGCPVNDTSGNRVGQVEDILLNPGSGRIDFAVISLSSTGGTETSQTAASGKLVPVPWSLLQPASMTEGANGTGQALTLTANADKLAQAPAIDQSNWSEMRQSDWRQRVYSYYGVTEYPAGAAESPQGVNKGAGAEQLEQGTQQPEPPQAPGAKSESTPPAPPASSQPQ